MSDPDKYKHDCRRKLLLMLEAAEANPSTKNDIELATIGNSPMMRVTIPAYILRQLTKEVP